MKEAIAYSTIHPGEVLERELKERGISQKDFASTIGMPSTVLNALINRKRNITPDIAVLLEAALDKDAAFWLALQAQRDIEEARMKEDFLRKQQDIETWSSIQDYCNTGFLEKFVPNGLGKSLQDKIHTTLSFFHVSDVSELRGLFLSDVDPAFFRKSKKQTEDPINLFTWKYMAFNQSDATPNPEARFDSNLLDNLILDLKTIFYENQNTIKRLKEKLSEYGIKFIMIPNQRGIHVDGFSFWHGNYPTITLTGRWQKLDILAFSLLHEICHVFFHLRMDNQEKNCITIGIEGDKSSREEQEADTFANAQLIPSKDWQTFKATYSRLNPYAIIPKLRQFSKQHGIHPSIVLGRYQHDYGVHDNGRGIVRSIN